MDVLIAVLVVLVVVSILFEIARRVGVPYPSLFVLGGLGLAFVPGLPRLTLEPDLVLLVFLPPLLFSAAFETPLRELRRYVVPIGRLSIGLVIFTMVLVAAVAQAAIPGLGWPAAFALGAIVAPTDALAATSVFRRLGAPRVVVSLIEGKALLNDATALVAYRAAVVAAVSGSFVLSDAIGSFVLAAAGGILLGVAVGVVLGEVVRRLNDPPVEVAISLVIPFAAYLPADALGLSGVLAAVRSVSSLISPRSRSCATVTRWASITPRWISSSSASSTSRSSGWRREPTTRASVSRTAPRPGRIRRPAVGWSGRPPTRPR